MADNVAITPGTGATVAADDIGSGVLVQRVKSTWGPDGTANDTDVASGKAIPVQVRSSTGLIPIGEPTDAKSVSTDTTSVSMISILKQLSASMQSLDAKSTTYTASASFTCGTSAYVAGEPVGTGGGAAAIAFGSIGPSAGGVMEIIYASLRIDTSAIISGETSYVLYFFNVTPPSALADSASVWDLPSGDRASFLGSLNLGSPVDVGQTLFVELSGSLKFVNLAGSTLYAYLVTVGAYTPTARTFQIKLAARPA